MIRAGRPIHLEPGQRYLRSRANRRVRKARIRQGLGRVLLVVSLQVAVVCALGYAGSRVVRQLRSAEEFAVDQVEIAGTTRASVESVQHQLARYRGRNLLDLDLEQVAADAARNPWLRSVSVRRILPGTLRVTVVERVPRAAALVDGVSHLVDTTGFVIAPSDAVAPMDLPVLTGLDSLEGPALHDAIVRGVDAIARLEREAGAWIDEISELDFSVSDRIVVRTVDPGPRVLLDPDHPDRNVQPFLELRREIERRVGEAAWVDLRWSDRLSVMPADHVSAQEGS